MGFMSHQRWSIQFARIPPQLACIQVLFSTMVRVISLQNWQMLQIRTIFSFLEN